ncbi:MAG: hypothetical protein M3Y58_19990 [Chloroflexota bacterium]|nr:hypothetical protein [Chloroflexota bacterium]
MSDDQASASNGAYPTSEQTQQQFTFLSEVRSYVGEEAGWIRTLTDAIQRGVAGEETATDVGRAVADVSAPYRAEIARLRGLDIPEGCEAAGTALIAETDAAAEYLAALARWTAAGQVGISLLRDNAGEEVHHALEQFLAARDAFEQAYTEAARLLE